MGDYAMQKVKEAVRQNFRDGRWNFKVFGVVIRIQHRHTNQFAVVVFDPVIQQDAEILRIINGDVPMFA